MIFHERLHADEAIARGEFNILSYGVGEALRHGPFGHNPDITRLEGEYLSYLTIESANPRLVYPLPDINDVSWRRDQVEDVDQ